MYDIDQAWANRHTPSSATYGYTPGPLRWLRMRMNSVQRPNSCGAKLFRARCEHAGRVAQTVGAGHFYEQRSNTYDYRQHEYEDRRAYTLCSPFCAALDAVQQTSPYTWSWDGLNSVRTDNPITVERVMNGMHEISLDTIKRPVRCFVCARTVFPDGTIRGKSIWEVAVPEIPDARRRQTELLAAIIEQALKLNERSRKPSVRALEQSLERLTRA